jgi:outer membrane protein assembly factor BamB
MTKQKILVLSVCVCLIVVAWSAISVTPVRAGNPPDWSQWGGTFLHTSSTPAIGRTPSVQLASLTFDPFVGQEQAEAGGVLLAHYQVPLVDGNNVFLEYKTGTYVSCNPPGSGNPYPCGPNAWNSEIWNERAFNWQNGSLVELWNFQSDWKPEPNSDVGGKPKSPGLVGWEPVFHAAVWSGYVFVPGWGGTVYKLNESDGTAVAQYNPSGSSINPNAYVSGPLTVDSTGNVYYNVVVLAPTSPWTADVQDAWLVKITSEGVVQTVSYNVLVPKARRKCFDGQVICGSQRPGINVAPAVSADGSMIFTSSRAHLPVGVLFSYVIGVNSDLTPAWQTSLYGLLGKTTIGYIVDEASSSPVVAPDGSVIYGVLTSTAYSHLIKFSSSGQFLATYQFGWDDTPAIYAHDGTYSVITKDNEIGGGPYFITQLNSNLKREWSYKDPTTTQSHPRGYEWCVNAPAVDANGTVYADNEDGNLYAINQGGTLRGNVFLQESIGAAYTPVSVGGDGKVYTLNDGQMFVLGTTTGK